MPVGPVHEPLDTVSVWPTTAEPVIVPAEVTSTVGRAGGAGASDAEREQQAE